MIRQKDQPVAVGQRHFDPPQGQPRRVFGRRVPRPHRDPVVGDDAAGLGQRSRLHDLVRGGVFQARDEEDAGRRQVGKPRAGATG
jgi:hypothetical protein